MSQAKFTTGLKNGARGDSPAQGSGAVSRFAGFIRALVVGLSENDYRREFSSRFSALSWPWFVIYPRAFFTLCAKPFTHTPTLRDGWWLSVTSENHLYFGNSQ
ncbi:MAG: hypothetical protein DWP95_10295 [Proteobacteria bacterium]|nr:MAG: hypothetical protein DWP95_10295 [Pseudomonadota bacterium]